MSEEIGQAAGDLAYWQRRAERAEADAEQLRGSIIKMKADMDVVQREMPLLRADIEAQIAELTAARAVVALARQQKKIAKHIWTQPGESTTAVSEFEIALDRAIESYDRVTAQRPGPPATSQE
jgi:hypothetical protein